MGIAIAVRAKRKKDEKKKIKENSSCGDILNECYWTFYDMLWLSGCGRRLSIAKGDMNFNYCPFCGSDISKRGL